MDRRRHRRTRIARGCHQYRQRCFCIAAQSAEARREEARADVLERSARPMEEFQHGGIFAMRQWSQRDVEIQRFPTNGWKFVRKRRTAEERLEQRRGNL